MSTKNARAFVRAFFSYTVSGMPKSVSFRIRLQREMQRYFKQLAARGKKIRRDDERISWNGIK